MSTNSGYFSQNSIAVLSATSGIATALCFPPCGLSSLAWGSLVPWLYLLPKLSFRQILHAHAIFVLCFFGLGLMWIVKVHPICLPAIIIPLYFVCLPFPLLLAWFVRNKIALIVSAPIIWTANEYVRSFMFSGFPWLYLGHSQAFCPPLIQIADIAGVYGISFLVVLSNSWLVCICEFCIHPQRSRRIFLFAYTSIVFTLLLANYLYGMHCLAKSKYRLGPKIACVQGNIPQNIKDDPRVNRKKIAQVYQRLSMQALQKKPQMLVWPETMCLDDPMLEPKTRMMFAAMSRSANTYLLIGSYHYAVDSATLRTRSYNSAYFINPQGQFQGRYDKKHLVPFGEYVPLYNLLSLVLPALHNTIGYVTNLQAGSANPVFKMGQYRFGTLICYDIVFAEEARKLAQQGSQFIVNITNEGWFPRCSEPEQILQIAIFRAVENRIGILRAGNTGITLNIPPSGRLIRQNILAISATQGWDITIDGYHLKWKEFPGIFCQRVPLAQQASFYRQWGDIFAKILCATVVVLFAATAIYSKKKGPH